MKQNTIRAVCVTAMLGAIGWVLMLLEFPLPFLIPPFIKLDFSELAGLIASFAYGPLYGVLVCLLKNLLHLFSTNSAGVGELSNFLLGAIFCAVCGLVYKYDRSRKGALIGCLLGAAVSAVIGVFTNAFVVYPAYVVLYGMPMEAILGMYQTLLPAANTLWKALLIFNLPFTFFKGVIDAAICFLIYKRLSPILKGSNQKNNS